MMGIQSFNNINGFKRTLVIALVSISMIMLVACEQESIADRGTDGGIISDTLQSNVTAISTALVRKIIDQKKKDETNLEEIKKFDFKFPDDSNYKNSKQWSVFEDSIYTSRFVEKFKSIIQNVSSGDQYTISLANRVEGVGTDQPDLLFILPGIKEDFCNALLRNTLNLKYNAVVEIPALSYSLNLSPHSEQVDEKDIVTLPRKPSSAGCFQSQGRLYYYQVLYEL